MAIAFVQYAEGGAATGTAVTVPVPIGTLDGHVMVALLGKLGAGGFTAPAGWTQLVTRDDGVVTTVYYRVASSEPASYTWTWASSNRNRGDIMTYSGVDTTTPMDVAASIAGGGTATSITTVTDGAVAVAMFTHPNTNFTLSTGGYTTRVNRQGATCRVIVADRVVSPAGATGTVVTATAYHSVLAALRPTAGKGLPVIAYHWAQEFGIAVG